MRPRDRRSDEDARTVNGPTTDWDAASYHRVSDPHVAWGERVLDRLHLQGAETVLDAGCGTGRLTELLLGRLPRGRVIALDRSPSMLREARQYLAPLFGDRVTFLQANLGELDLVCAVDAVFSTATFHWVRDHPDLFRRLWTSLRPGGSLVAQCGGGPNLARLLGRASERAARPPYAPFFARWSHPWEFSDAPTAARRLHDAGFVDVQTSIEPAPTVLDGPETYAQFLRAVIFREHLDRLPDETLQAQFIQALTAAAAHDDPPFSLDYWRLNLAGRKPAGA